MPEHIRALIVIIVLQTVSMAIMRKPAALLFEIKSQVYTRRCLLWLWVTTTVFLTGNFVLFALAAAYGLWFTAKRDPNPAALYLFLLCTLPLLATSFGFGMLWFELSYPRLLSLFVLYPTFVMLLRVKHPRRRSFRVDWLIIAYICLTLMLQLLIDTFTNTLRYGFYAFLDVFLPYYVMSRYVVTIEVRRQVVIAFVMGILLLCPIAVFEVFWSWLLYVALPAAVGIQVGGPVLYIGRGDSIRALVSSGQPIVLGYVIMVAILFLAGIDRAGIKAKYWMLALAILSAGIIAALSRGPWVGLVAGLLILWFTSPKPSDWLVKLGVGSLVAVPVLAMTDAGAKLIDYLPFVGTIDSSNVDYRSTLIDVALEVVWLSPWFGNPNYVQHPAFAVLDQGGGAVDVTNTFVVVALSNGLVGLALFAGIFFAASFRLLRSLMALGRSDNELFTQGRILLAAIGATVVVLVTLSPILVVPYVYWCLCGLAMGYSREVDKK
jgi:hypothetical protein